MDLSNLHVIVIRCKRTLSCAKSRNDLIQNLDLAFKKSSLSKATLIPYWHYIEGGRWRWKATTRRVAAWKTNGLSAKPISIVDQAPPHCEQETFNTVDSGSPVDVNAELGWENLLGCSQNLRSKNSAFSHKFVFVKNRTERSERSPCFRVGCNWHCWAQQHHWIKIYLSWHCGTNITDT